MNFANGPASTGVTLFDAASTTLTVTYSTGDSGQATLDATPAVVRGLILTGLSLDSSPSILAGCSGPVEALTCVSSGEASDYTLGGPLSAHIRQIDVYGSPVAKASATGVVIDAALSASDGDGSVGVSGDDSLTIAQGHTTTTNAVPITRLDGSGRTMSARFTIDGNTSSPALTVTLSS